MSKRSRRVLEREQGIGEVVQRLTDTIGGREGQEDIVATIVADGRREINPGFHVLPMTSVVKQQVARKGGWSERRSRKEENAGHAKPRVKSWAAKNKDC